MPPAALIRRPEGDEALAQAEAEGLTLHPKAPSSYRGVTARRKGFCATMSLHGRTKWLGDFLTVEGAALAYAQEVAAKDTWVAPPPPPPRAPALLTAPSAAPSDAQQKREPRKRAAEGGGAEAKRSRKCNAGGMCKFVGVAKCCVKCRQL